MASRSEDVAANLVRTRGLFWSPSLRMWVWVCASFGRELQHWSWRRAKQRCSAPLLPVLALDRWRIEVVSVVVLIAQSSFGLMAETCI